MKGNRRGLLLGQDLDLLNLNQFLFCMYLLHLLDDSRLHLYSCLIHLDLLHLDLLDLDRKKEKKLFLSFWVGMTRRSTRNVRRKPTGGTIDYEEKKNLPFLRSPHVGRRSKGWTTYLCPNPQFHPNPEHFNSIENFFHWGSTNQKGLYSAQAQVLVLHLHPSTYRIQPMINTA
ncbi:hypothetical protein GBA52_015341 [Prunus armeniaca]|nr:hypothetical protein GBA52_015341 [Prunus armeniaca]